MTGFSHSVKINIGTMPRGNGFRLSQAQAASAIDKLIDGLLRISHTGCILFLIASVRTFNFSQSASTGFVLVSPPNIYS